MAKLILLLLGVEFLRERSRGLFVAGVLLLVAGAAVFIDALDGALFFPLHFFGLLFVLEGMATLLVARSGVGGQRLLRLGKGLFAVLVGALVLAGHHHGHFLLSMLFGALFLVDGLLQCMASSVVRYQRWKYVFAAGVAEILIAIFFFQPYPTHYVGTLPYGLGLFLCFAGLKLVALARRARRLVVNPVVLDGVPTAAAALDAAIPRAVLFDGPPAPGEPALTVHVWTPSGSAKADTRSYPLVDRYIAAMDVNGVVSTGHAALESPEGVYISLYPATEIDRSPDQFGATLRASPDNHVPGVFQPDYATEAAAWQPSTAQVRIRNYDPAQLRAFWQEYRRDATYNLTYRNCSTSVARALEAALDGAARRLHGERLGWLVLLRLLLTPELWVAAQIRKRAMTMAWTPGLMLDYARAMSMLADPRPFGWWTMAQAALRHMAELRRSWREGDREATADRSV
ncbi:hypothetical protein GCM10027082_44360 [Comamonas humi]